MPINMIRLYKWLLAGHYAVKKTFIGYGQLKVWLEYQRGTDKGEYILNIELPMQRKSSKEYTELHDFWGF